ISASLDETESARLGDHLRECEQCLQSMGLYRLAAVEGMSACAASESASARLEHSSSTSPVQDGMNASLSDTTKHKLFSQINSLGSPVSQTPLSLMRRPSFLARYKR